MVIRFGKLLLLLLVMMWAVACAADPTIVEVPVTVQVTRMMVEEVLVEADPVEVTRVVTATPTVAPETETAVTTSTDDGKRLVVCMGAEPTSLYWYGSNRLVSKTIWHAIYENDYTTLAFAYQAQGLERLPDMANGDAALEVVMVEVGDRVVDVNGDVVVLSEGVEVVTADDEVVSFVGDPLRMTQLVVDFEMKPRVWADGTAVTAEDSVYSFQLASDPSTPASKFKSQRTANYEATGALSTRWTGLPGFLDTAYFTNFWRPLPQHLWGDLTAAELVTAELSAVLPLGDGPFMIEAWSEGAQIDLVRNPNYYRAAEGLPKLDALTFKFLPEPAQLLAQMLSGGCDIATQDGLDGVDLSFLLEAEAQGLVATTVNAGVVLEQIDFGVNSYDGYGDDVGRPDWFEDVRVRQAMAMCTNRQAMRDEVLYGRSEVMASYVSTIHPLYAEDVTVWPYDVTTANTLLDDVGFSDRDGDGIREYGRSGTDWDGTPFRVTLLVEAESETRRQIAQIFQQNMQQCGIEVRLRFESASAFYAAGPLGDMFGRQFDLALFAWLTDIEPACDLFISETIPGPIEEGFGGWRGFNVTGWSDDGYDRACLSALSQLSRSDDYVRDHQQAQRIFADELPTIPLFLRPNVVVAQTKVLNYGVDSTQDSSLWNVFEIDVVP